MKLSSITNVSAGSMPVSQAARRKGSGSGLPSRTSLRLTVFMPGLDDADGAQIGVDDQPVGIGHHRLHHALAPADRERFPARRARPSATAHAPDSDRICALIQSSNGSVQAELVAHHLVDRLAPPAPSTRSCRSGGGAMPTLFSAADQRLVVQRLAVDQRPVHVPVDRLRHHSPIAYVLERLRSCADKPAYPQGV